MKQRLNDRELAAYFLGPVGSHPSEFAEQRYFAFRRAEWRALSIHYWRTEKRASYADAFELVRRLFNAGFRGRDLRPA